MSITQKTVKEIFRKPRPHWVGDGFKVFPGELFVSNEMHFYFAAFPLVNHMIQIIVISLGFCASILSLTPGINVLPL